MMRLPFALLTICALSMAALPLRASAETVTVFAAASLKTALDAIAPDFEAATGHDLVPVYAGSSALARQIAQGAPADMFVSANTAWMDWLAQRGRVVPDTRIDLLSNRLVLIAPAGTAPVTLDGDTDLAGLLGDGRLAMALVDAVPAGLYGKAALQSLDLWDGVEPRVAQADNVRAALALVALGAAPLGIVYASDAVAEPRVDVLATFPADSYPPIIYPAALIRDSAGARALLDWLHGAQAQAVFAAQGFALMQD